MHIFSKFEKVYVYFCPCFSSCMPLTVSFANSTTFWSTLCRIDGNFFTMVLYLFSSEMVVPYLECSALATFSLSHLSSDHLLSTCSHFCPLGKIVLKKKKNPFFIVFPTEFCFAFSSSITKIEKDSECFYLHFILIKAISKWDRVFVYKFYPC